MAGGGSAKVDHLSIGGGGAGGRHDCAGRDFSWNDVVGQDADELFTILWFEQGLNGASWELGKRRIGRGKHRVRTWLSERIFEAAGLDCCNEGLELTGLRGGLNNIHGLVAVGAMSKTRCGKGCQSQGEVGKFHEDLLFG